MYITNAFEKEIQNIENLLSKNKDMIIPKILLKKIDLMDFDPYNRHDLIESFLSKVVFTPFSSIEKITIPSLDTGRC